MKKKVVSVFALLILATSSYAQSSFSMHFDVAPAMGAFKLGEYDDFGGEGSLSTNDPNGFAGTGAGLGFEVQIPIGDKGLNAILGVDCYRHAVKSSIRKLEDSDLQEYQSVNYSEYYNIPILAGLHYEYDVSENFAVFGQVTGGLNLLKVSKSEFVTTQSYADESIIRKYDLARSFGFGIKVGFLFNQRFILGVGFKSLGAHTIDVTRTKEFNPKVPELNAYTETATYIDVKNVSMLNLSFGIRF